MFPIFLRVATEQCSWSVVFGAADNTVDAGMNSFALIATCRQPLFPVQVCDVADKEVSEFGW